MMVMPPIKPVEPWQPNHFVGQYGTLSIDSLPDLGTDGFEQVLRLSQSPQDLSAKQLAEVSHAYRKVAILTTMILINLMTK